MGNEVSNREKSGDDETATALCARFATVSDGVKGWTRTLAAEVRQRQAEEVEDSIGGDDCAAHLGELRRGLAVVDKLSAFCSARSGAAKGDDFEVIARYFREHLDQRLDCRRFIDACAYREWALCTRQSTPPRGPLEEAWRRRERRLWNAVQRSEAQTEKVMLMALSSVRENERELLDDAQQRWLHYGEHDVIVGGHGRDCVEAPWAAEGGALLSGGGARRGLMGAYALQPFTSGGARVWRLDEGRSYCGYHDIYLYRTSGERSDAARWAIGTTSDLAPDPKFSDFASAAECRRRLRAEGRTAEAIARIVATTAFKRGANTGWIVSRQRGAASPVGLDFQVADGHVGAYIDDDALCVRVCAPRAVSNAFDDDSFRSFDDDSFM